MSSSILDEEENNNSSISITYRSDENNSYFDSFIKIPDNNINHSSSVNNNQELINKNDEKKNKIINEVKDLVKCYICLEQIKKPKMCSFCHRLACGDCIKHWMRENQKCGYCRHNITIFDFIDVPFMKDIPQLIDYNKNLEEKKEHLEEENKILNKKLNAKQCNKHNEKILYYCFNCNQKLCGKCTSFTNEESKIHIGHKIFEFSEVEKSKYNEIINQIDTVKEQKKDLNNKIKEYEDIKKFNEFKFEIEKQLLDKIYKEIESHNKEINSKILERKSRINKINKKIDEKCEAIGKDLLKIESLDKMVDNLNIDEIKKEFKNLKDAEKIKEKNDKNVKDNSLIEFKSFIYNFENNKISESLMKEKDLKIKIETPLPITILLEIIREDLLLINFPVSTYIIEKKDNILHKKINLYTFLQINNTKYVEFKKVKKSSLFYGLEEGTENSNNNILPNLESSYIENKFDDVEDDKELKNLVNNLKSERKNANIEQSGEENLEYRARVKLSDFKKENKLSLVIYYYSLYN